MSITIDARGVYYRQLNERVREAIRSGETSIRIFNVTGQRYIGGGLQSPQVTITVEGVPGEDMAAFMAGPRIEVFGNAQDGVGNTMNDGQVIVHGLAGDVVGYGMRGGKVFIRDDVGYRVGIHMKGFMDKQPALVIGGCAGDFFGEYQAGGCLVLLGLHGEGRASVVGDYCATGMHGGVMYIRGALRESYLGKEVKRFEMEDQDAARLRSVLEDFGSTFQIDEDLMDFGRYHKIIPVSARPYGQLYAY